MGMGRKEGPWPSEKRVWSQIYQTMKEMLRSQKSQVETLINDQEFLEDYIRIQHELSSARTRFIEFHIAQMKKEQAKSRLVESAKLDVLIGFKESDSLWFKKQLELAESDLEDFRSCMEVLSAEMDVLKEKLRVAEADKGNNTVDVSGSPKNIKQRDQCIMPLKKEIKKLKHAYENLSSIKNTEVSALLAEKDFVWNQFRKMEGDYLDLLKFKSSEAGQAKEASEKLQVSVENLQQSIKEKEAIIARLEAKRVIMELDATKCTEEVEEANNKMKRLHLDMDELHAVIMEKDRVISSLREELSKLKMDLKQSSLERSTSEEKKSEGKTAVGSSTMKQSHLQKSPRKHNLNSCGSTRSRKPTFETPTSDNVPRSHKALSGKRGRTAIVEKPSLFHTDFKIPKLKNSRLLSP